MDKAARANWRRSRRWHVMWPALIVGGDERFPCTILDISESGARVESIWGPLPKLPLKLQCERFGTLNGRLSWARGKTAGLCFDLSPAEVVKLLKPLVPGLDRKDRFAHRAAVKAAPRRRFGKKPGAAPSLALGPPSKTLSDGSKARIAVPIAA